MTERLSIAAVTVNHNTSRYAELMLRSLLATHVLPDNWSVAILDNDSTDSIMDLRRFARSHGMTWQPSGFSTQTRNNSHGQILRQFVLDTPNCSNYLFLDADVCFLERDTTTTMLAELEATPDAFGIGPRLSWDGITEIPLDARRANPDIQDTALSLLRPDSQYATIPYHCR